MNEDREKQLAIRAENWRPREVAVVDQKPMEPTDSGRIVGYSPEIQKLLQDLHRMTGHMLRNPPTRVGGVDPNWKPEMAQQFDIIIGGYGIKRIHASS